MDVLKKLPAAPMISAYARNRGWPFVMAWGHRISGLAMAGFLLLHIYTLSMLADPAVYDAKMKLLSNVLFVFFEWALAIPVIFHALNGCRLILYETFGFRNDESLIRWVLSLSSIYVVLSALIMIMGNQTASPVFFWLLGLTLAVSMGYLVFNGTRKTHASITWRLQRVTGAFLFVMITAHFLFMHLNRAVGHEADVVIARMQNPFIKLVDVALTLAILYHAGYGLVSIAKDYLGSMLFRNLCAILVAAVMVVFAWMGIRLILLV